MIAVIETGGKQYLIKNGDSVKIEKLEAAEGETVTFDKVLLTANDDGSNAKVGLPYLDGVTVSAVIEKQGRAKKIRVIKFKRKVRYKRVHGHRQHVTKVTIK